MERLEPLRNALTQLEQTFTLITNKSAEVPSDVRLIYQTAAVKSFEYVYEISVRLIRRHLERTSDSALLIEKMDFKPLIRTAAEKGLVWNLSKGCWKPLPRPMIHIEPTELNAVKTILHRHVPDVSVYVFGSRSHGRQLKPFSDLDLCLRDDQVVPTTVISALKDAFSESNLPFKVDVVDWLALPDYFREAIEAELQPLTGLPKKLSQAPAY